MFNWFKPKPPAERDDEPRSGLFSTDLPTGSLKGSALLREVQKRSIQRTPQEFEMVGPDNVAMDSGESFSNMKSAFSLAGSHMPDGQLYFFANQGFIGYQLCAVLAQNWLIEKCCVQPGRDAVRNGYEIKVGGGVDVPPAVIEAIKDADEHYGINRAMVEFVKFGRTFGIRIAMFVVRSPDPDYYVKPFNPDGIQPGSYGGISQIDPYWCSPELSARATTDPTAIDFYEPTFWVVQGRRIHRSHLVIMRGAEVPDILKPSYLYGGVSIPQRIYERVYAAERTANEGPLLALSKRTRTLATNLSKVITNPGKLLQTLMDRAERLNNFGTDVIDAKEDRVEHHDTTLNDFDSVVMTQYQLVAAAANYPATKMLGTTPKGFNSSGQYEENQYNEELDSIKANDLTPLLRRHHLMVWRSDVQPLFQEMPRATRISHVWEPSATLTAKERAEVNKLNAETGKILSESSAIDGIDERSRITNDKDSGYSGLPAVQPQPDLDGDLTTRNPLAVAAQPAQGTLPAPAADGAHAMDAGLWDPIMGTLDGAELVTNQTLIDPDKVREKLEAEDFTVQVTPAFMNVDGRTYRVVIDGHHSLAAATRAGVPPNFVLADYTDSDYRNATTLVHV